MAKTMNDIALAKDDLQLLQGDFLIKESTPQHQRLLIMNNNGDLKQFPSVCVGAADYFDDENFQALLRKISIEFAKDGMEVRSVTLNTEGIIKTNAFYI